MSEDVRIEAAAEVFLCALRALQQRYGPDNATRYEDDPTRIGVSLRDGSFVDVFVPTGGAADAVSVPPLPYEDLDAIEKWGAAALADYQKDRSGAVAFCAYEPHLPTHSVRSQMLALVAEVRRARAGSVSEYQQTQWWIREDEEDGFLQAAEFLSAPLVNELGWKRVWVRKEDAT